MRFYKSLLDSDMQLDRQWLCPGQCKIMFEWPVAGSHQIVAFLNLSVEIIPHTFPVSNE